MYAPLIRNLRDVWERGLGIGSTSCSRQPSSVWREDADEVTADLISVPLLIHSPGVSASDKPDRREGKVSLLAWIQ